MGELTDDQYRDAVELCRRVVAAATSDDGGPTVAGSFLGELRALFTADVATHSGVARLSPGLHEGLRWRTGHKTPHLIRILMSNDAPDLAAWPDGDPPIGFFTDPTHAARAVEAVNLVRAGLCGLQSKIAGEARNRDAKRIRHCADCERCTWNPGPDCGLPEHPHCPVCGHCSGRHTGKTTQQPTSDE